jgi:hypothetical protein
LQLAVGPLRGRELVDLRVQLRGLVPRRLVEALIDLGGRNAHRRPELLGKVFLDFAPLLRWRFERRLGIGPHGFWEGSELGLEDSSAERLAGRCDLLLQLRDLLVGGSIVGVDLLLLPGRDIRQESLLRVLPVLRIVSRREKRCQLVVVGVSERIELVRMALGAVERKAQHARREYLHGVEQHLMPDVRRIQLRRIRDIRRLPQKTGGHQQFGDLRREFRYAALGSSSRRSVPAGTGRRVCQR